MRTALVAFAVLLSACGSSPEPAYYAMAPVHGAPRDGVKHSIIVRADGFATRNLDTVFDRDVAVDVTLSPVAPPPPTQQKGVAPPKPTAAPTKPSRQIDEGDPYRP